jgi:oligopeptide/dipeptide ABC transporter ATP-binding protein
MTFNTDPLLSVRGLSVSFRSPDKKTFKAVDDIDLDIYPNEILGLVGESGSGKTVTCLSILRLLQSSGCMVQGQIYWQGQDLLRLNGREMRRIRGREIAMIFQNPQACLNPVYTVGEQIISVLRLHQRLSRQEARQEAIRLLELVRLPNAKGLLNKYAHQCSGGMCQRIMIAIALACKPKLLIADEPTSALDVTVQAALIELLLELRSQFNTAILLVSHDLGVVAQMCDRVAVAYQGQIMEVAPAQQLYANPLHPYTQILLQSVPVPDPDQRHRISTSTGEPTALTQNLGTGCRFRSRCPQAFEQCEKEPSLHWIDAYHASACWLSHKYCD